MPTEQAGKPSTLMELDFSRQSISDWTMHKKNEGLAEFKISLGSNVISIVAANQDALFAVDSAQKLFTTNQQPEIMLRTHCIDVLPPYPLQYPIFSSGGPWGLFRNQGQYILYGYPGPGEIPDRMLVISPDFKSGDIYIQKKKSGYPLEYPFDEILMIGLLSFGQGILIHASGVKNNGLGSVFIGASGAGKSTMANLWKNRVNSMGNSLHSVVKKFAILSDDRVIIRKIDGQFWIYGTPWHGDAEVFSPEKAPLENIFFINHARENKVKALGRIDAVSRFLVCSFLPFWNKQGMEFALEFIDELTRKVPCYDFGFVPDEDVIDFIKNI